MRVKHALCLLVLLAWCASALCQSPDARARVALALAQAPAPDQAQPIKPYCLCWRDGDCPCGVCVCPGGRKLLTSDHGRGVWFKRSGGQWVPDEPGWVYDAGAGAWHRPPPQPAFHPAALPPLPSLPRFGGFGGFSGGMRSGGRSC